MTFSSKFLGVCLVCFAGGLLAKTGAAALDAGYSIPSTPTAATNEQQFEDFMKKHKITFSDASEKAKRLAIFNENLQKHEKLNKEKKHGSATFGVTAFSHLTPDEFMDTMVMKVDIKDYIQQGNSSGAQVPPQTAQMNINRNKRSASNVPPNNPTSFDWRNYSMVTPVKNQGSCGDCYAFATIANIESQVAISGGGLVDLSEQELTSCNGFSCSGGDPFHTLEYVIANGVHYENAEPFVANSTYNPSCPSSWNNSQKVYIDGIFTDLAANEDNMAAWLVNSGPFVIGWYADATFGSYTGGIYRNSASNCPSMNHVILVVGYGVSSNGTRYWIAKNSWGTGWGQQGYIQIERGVNTCNITSYVMSGIIKSPNLTMNAANPMNCSNTYTSVSNGYLGIYGAAVPNGCQYCNVPAQLGTCWNGGSTTVFCPMGTTCQQSSKCVASCAPLSTTTTTKPTTTITTTKPTPTTSKPTTTLASCSASSGGQIISLPSGCQFCNGAQGNTTSVATCVNGSYQVNNCPNGQICYGNGQCAISCH